MNKILILSFLRQQQKSGQIQSHIFDTCNPIQAPTSQENTPNKALRILIIDNQHFNRMSIERKLNRLGYHRIAPVSSVQEMLQIIEYEELMLDLIIVSSSIVPKSQLDLDRYFADNVKIHRSLIYNAQKDTFSDMFTQNTKTLSSNMELPSLHLLERLMNLFD